MAHPYNTPGNSELPDPSIRTVHLTDENFWQKNYRSHGPIPRAYLSGKYLRGGQIWEEPPTKHDAIKIGRLLGKGGYGEVYQIWKVTAPQQKFALKIPGEPLSLTTGYIFNEIHKLNMLSSSCCHHVPKTRHGFFILYQKKIPYYITHIYSPVEKKFPAFAEELPMDPVQTLQLFYLIAKGFKHITSFHIVHNDVKPENIMFYQDIPVITDYGTARSYSEINEVEIERLQGRLHGTPVWLPPELISIIEQKSGPPAIYFNLGKVGQKTDIWGLGLILMRYLTGKSIFHDVPLKRQYVPNIFYSTHHQFYHANIVSRYRQSSLRLMQRLYGINDTLDTNPKIDIDKVRALLEGDGSDELPLGHLQGEKNKRDEKNEPASGRVLVAKLITEKMKLSQRTRSNSELNEFFLATLFDLFDLCAASLIDRVKIYQLVDILETVFPRLKQYSQAIETSANFPELISLDEMGNKIYE